MDDLLHSVVAMLGSFRDLLALAATCTSWRAAFSSYSSKSTLLPPLLLQPGVPICFPRPHPLSNSLIPKRPCFCTDLANQDMHMCCQIPLLIDVESFRFIGASCGHIFLAREKTCLVIDIFTGFSVSPPQVPAEGYSQPYYAALTAPLASPNSHLLVITPWQTFFWRVGSQSWLRCTKLGTPKQVVVFKGQVFVMNHDHTLFVVHFVPQIHLQQIAIDWAGEGVTGTYEWLVACDDMLLMVSFQCSLSLGNAFKAFRLDLSSKPAKWVEVEELKNWAIFISIDVRICPLCCINPERWGGRNNCVYYCSRDSEGWVAFQLGKPLQRDASNRSISILSSRQVQPISPRPHPLSNSLIPKQPCHCTDLANQDMYMSCQVSLVIDAESFHFIGASCGHIFLARKQTCLVVDTFTGVSVPPPQVPNEGYTQPYYAALTAPLASPDSLLAPPPLRQSFFWRVGSQSWLRCSNIGTPKQVVVFKGQVFVMNSDRMLLLVHFVPEIYLQEIAIDWVGEGMTGTYEWLVACDDMLLMVSLQCSLSLGDTFKAFRLDLSTKPAKWVEVERLENWAIFISIEVRIRPLCCINPDRWGGRSNCVYYCSHNSEGWVAVELGKPLQRDASNRSICIWSNMRMEPM
ncbi:hypothetical protein CFC21_095332 [Triticum aestivum]|uniref:KIB1-4 beta-propeller domain-containing protein n=2 Tax=Triticum aestivum TaxID=4565 RepID=A0A9R1LQ66_WHEAT|nr:hypothetical protein CFC21_095332 [Triticum aestivum]